MSALDWSPCFIERQLWYLFLLKFCLLCGKGNQTYYDKSDQMNQFLCTLNQNETFAFYGSILFGIHLQVCLQGLSRESEISIKGHLWILVLFVINCQLLHWPWWVKAIWCWLMKIRQLTLTISRNLCRLAGGVRWLPLPTRQRQFPPWQDVATALSSGHNIHSCIKHQQHIFAMSSSDVFIWSYIIIVAFKHQLYASSSSSDTLIMWYGVALTLPTLDSLFATGDKPHLDIYCLHSCLPIEVA